MGQLGRVLDLYGRHRQWKPVYCLCICINICIYVVLLNVCFRLLCYICLTGCAPLVQEIKPGFDEIHDASECQKREMHAKKLLVASLLLVVRPGAPSSVLAPSRKAPVLGGRPCS